jgi:hypothetical protein
MTQDTQNTAQYTQDIVHNTQYTVHSAQYIVVHNHRTPYTVASAVTLPIEEEVMGDFCTTFSLALVEPPSVPWWSVKERIV